MDSGGDAVIVTGASSGIGGACVRWLAEAGFRVFGAVRGEGDGRALEAEGVEALLMDVADESAVAGGAEEVGERLGGGRLLGVVNNAGVAVTGPLELLPLGELRRQMEVNVTGTLAVTQAFLPLLREGRGRIVNVGSMNGRIATPFNAPYCASKFALEGLTDGLRRELHQFGVHVSLVEPGSVRTRIWEKYQRGSARQESEMRPRERELYGESLDAARRAAERWEKSGVKPEAVARAVERALTDQRPRTRYLVGLDAKLGVRAASLLPDRLLDLVIRRHMRLPE